MLYVDINILSVVIALLQAGKQLERQLTLEGRMWSGPKVNTKQLLFGCMALVIMVQGFDVGDLSENAADDLEGLDASAAHVANLLSTEPADIKLGVGGFSMGAATSLYCASCCALGKYGNGNPYPAKISTVVGLSGWLPCSKTLKNKLEGENEAVTRAASLPVLLCHGTSDDVVPYKFGEKSSGTLKAAGFQNVIFKSYSGLGHFTIPEEMDQVCAWLSSNLGLDGSSS
ncbi:hypothetical protein EUGRSUZ_C01119 [Eucalyptus grandis]|uniref:Uncharacterized protein n=2 Tax=Eucalyptus grandis TaxID=71139 RepID=A0ACC3LC38_EUCGR|nr:hypothetical protein EUGRSUZ_C01119 [Eucalyptus grandis]